MADPRWMDTALRDTCEQDDGVDGFGWTAYDARVGGSQTIRDGAGHVEIGTDFVKTEDGTLWELDGRRRGPLDRGKLESNEDVLSEKALVLGPLKFLGRESADLRFSCVVLAGSLD